MTPHYRTAGRGCGAMLLPVLLWALVAAPAQADEAAPVAPVAPATPPPPREATIALDARAGAAPKATSPKPARTKPAKAKRGSDFLRFTEDGRGGGKLESAVATYQNADGVTVHLVAALHVGEKSYYRSLSQRFAGYDALLYEMIKPRDSGVPARGERAGGALSGFQRFLTDVLDLEFQLDAVDYAAPNFVHADLDAETFFALQEDRGESLVGLMLKSMLSEMGRQGAGEGAAPISLIEILAAMNSPDSARQYKLLLARQFQDVEAQVAGMEGEKGSVILTERNKAAVEVLKKTIAEGKRNVGVFYGAAHMSGIAASLREMSFRRTGVEWETAWDMAAPASEPASKTPGTATPERAPAADDATPKAPVPGGADADAVPAGR